MSDNYIKEIEKMNKEMEGVLIFYVENPGYVHPIDKDCGCNLCEAVRVLEKYHNKPIEDMIK